MVDVCTVELSTKEIKNEVLLEFLTGTLNIILNKQLNAVGAASLFRRTPFHEGMRRCQNVLHGRSTMVCMKTHFVQFRTKF